MFHLYCEGTTIRYWTASGEELCIYTGSVINSEIYPSYNVTAQVLQVVDDVAVCLYVCMLDELGKVLLYNSYIDYMV